MLVTDLFVTVADYVCTSIVNTEGVINTELNKEKIVSVLNIPNSNNEWLYLIQSNKAIAI